MTTALVFPGQGAQEVGMGKDFHDAYAESRAVFEEADDALGFSLSGVIFNGPEDELVKTAVTQPAILTASVAVLRAFEKEYGKAIAPAFLAGHSLGEYTALVAADVLSLADAVKLVHKRGALMQEAVPHGMGAMSALLGLGIDDVRSLCEEASQGQVCSPANVNAPTQIVISGEAPAVERAGVLAKERGASKVIPLKVSAPFHCALMRPVADRLREEFAALAWRDPKVPVIANVDSSKPETVSQIQEAIYAQTYSPVMWADGALAMESEGVDLFMEFGPGNVLTGLIKRICKGKKTCATSKTSDIAKALAALGETEGGA